MNFAELFTEETIVRELRSSDRESCVREMLEALVAARRLAAKDVETAFEAFLKRERVGSTGIGNGVAIPHVKLEGAAGIAAAIGVHSEGIDFRAIDGEPVRIVFLVVRAPDESDEHLGFLRWVSRLGRSGDFRRFVTTVKTEAEILALLREMGDA